MMEAGSSSEAPRAQFMFPCVIGNRYPEFCKKAYPTIEKHNEHIARSHSPEYWCEACSHQFDGSLSTQLLARTKEQHRRRECPGKSLGENLNNRSRQFLMSEEQIKRFKSWKAVAIPQLALKDGSPETLSVTSWRRIREAIFPGSGVILLKEGLFRAPNPSSNRFVGNRSEESNYEPSYAALQKDEGYGSMIRSKQPREVSEEKLFERLSEQCAKDFPADHDTTSASSGYASIQTNVLDWEARLFEKLYKDLRLIDPTFNSIERLGGSVSPQLRSFSLRFTALEWLAISGGMSMLSMAIFTWVRSRALPNLNHQPTTTDLDRIDKRPLKDDEEVLLKHIFNSVAYRWLLTHLTQKLTLEVVDGSLDVHSRIHQDVYDFFEHSRHISMQKPSAQHQITFVTDWNPTHFLEEQFGSHCDIGRLLGETLTLTGAATDAQLLPCSEYLNQSWPTTGITFLELLRKALVSGEAVSGELEDKTSIRCEFPISGLTVQVKGITDSIAIIGEQIGWLGAALRPSCSDSGFSTCRPIFRVFGMFSDVAKGSFEFPTFPLDLTEGTPGQCWHAIFRNPVIVEGYPIPRRKKYGSGLEMPLNVMAGLNSSPRIHKYEGNYYLKGYSTALVPTEEINNMVFWHLYYSDDGSRLPYPNPTDLQCTDLSMQDLTAARHVVGWCSNAKFMTGAADMNYAIGASQLQRPGKEFALEKISFSFGQFVTGGCQFAIGRKDQHVRATKGTYIDKLKWLDKKYVTLWDVDDERGWLVNGNAALLHLLRSSLQHSSTDKFSSDFHFQPHDFQESKSPHSLDSALEVLRNSRNQQLELYDKDTDIQQGCVATSRTTIKDRVEELYEVLEKLFDYTVTSEASAKGLNAKSRFQDHLEGWDFTDIATNRDPFFIKRTTLGFSMLGWPDLVRANYAITLFGKGFGDLIEAVGAQQGGVCKEWMTVPGGRNLLCVSTSHLKDIITDAGGNLDTSPITVMPGLFWKVPASATPFDVSCQCDTGRLLSGKHHAVQSLISSKLWTGRSQACVKLDEHSHGAVIFGPLIDRKRPWSSSACITRSGSQSSNLSILGGSTTSSQTISQDVASSSSSVPASSPAESQGQTISGTSVVDPEASPPASGSTPGPLNPVEELLGTRELRRFRYYWFHFKKARRH